MNENSVRDFVSSWLATNADALGILQTKLARADAPSKKLVAWYESPEYLIDVSAWEHAACLDILAVSKKTKELAFSVCGSCEGTSGLATRLSAFATWLSAGHNANVA
jgi:hypothetical protein